MPIYEYKCDKCGEVFEKRQKFSDAPVTEHEVCGGPVHKLLSAPAFQFKGSGWYITDYGKGGILPKGESKSEAKADAKSESKSESKSDGNGTKSDASESKSTTSKSTASETSSTKSESKSDTSTK